MSSCFCKVNGCSSGEGQCEYNSECKCGKNCKVWAIYIFIFMLDII
jgi:hypothetical protein